jgi:threonyl-tRNA synthetase
MENNRQIETARHSLAHILAYAVQELYPQAKLGMGPATEFGFYYDFDFSPTGAALSDKDLPRIEKRMREIIKRKLEFACQESDINAAKELFKDQPYKFEIISDLEKENQSQVLIYQTGKFVDLCRGPHVKSTQDLAIDSFKLTKTAGAYWKGSEINPMLTRIYGVAFASKKELDEYLAAQLEAEKRDHRKLGQQLDLFVFSDLVGKGLPLYTRKGATIRRILERFIVDVEIERGYQHVCTPDIAKVDLYKVSGHYPYYKETMYPVMKVDEEELILRPMACPHHYQIYSAKPRSYRELPFRIAELAKLYRYEKSGELSGLTRVRTFCLADAHIICAKGQATKEINEVLKLIDFCTKSLGLKKGKDYSYRLSLGDRSDEKKYFKDDAAWDYAENLLRDVLQKRNADFCEAKNEAAFYGPKIDIQMKNILGKEETAFTVQYDFVGPKRFNMSYVGKDGKDYEPIVIHRSSIGAIDRIFAFLIEHYAGAFPLWLAPVQIQVLPISKKHKKYGAKICKELIGAGLRAELNDEDESIGKKIRLGELQKIPYLLIVGDNELKSKKVSVRKRHKGDMGTQKLQKLIAQLLSEIAGKKSL